MLFWEALSLPIQLPAVNPRQADARLQRTRRLPYDKRCSAVTKSGARCHGKIIEGSEFCFFHDPEMALRRRASRPTAESKRRRRLSNLPDGYLRKLTSLAAVGNAMDRLYREVRLGAITPEMGRVLFNILTRLMDSGLVTAGARPERSVASRVRPKLNEMLTRAERIGWRRAIDQAVKLAPPAPDTKAAAAGAERPSAASGRAPAPAVEPARVALQVAS